MMRTVVRGVALLVVALGVVAAPSVAAARSHDEVRAAHDHFCTELTAPDFGQVANTAQAKLVLGHYKRAIKDAPKGVRPSLRRVIAFLQRIVNGELAVSELGHAGAKLDHDFTKIFDRVDAICPSATP